MRNRGINERRGLERDARGYEQVRGGPGTTRSRPAPRTTACKASQLDATASEWLRARLPFLFSSLCRLRSERLQVRRSTRRFALHRAGTIIDLRTFARASMYACVRARYWCNCQRDIDPLID